MLLRFVFEVDAARQENDHPLRNRVEEMRRRLDSRTTKRPERLQEIDGTVDGVDVVREKVAEFSEHSEIGGVVGADAPANEDLGDLVALAKVAASVVHFAAHLVLKLCRENVLGPFLGQKSRDDDDGDLVDVVGDGGEDAAGGLSVLGVVGDLVALESGQVVRGHQNAEEFGFLLGSNNGGVIGVVEKGGDDVFSGCFFGSCC